MTRGKRIALELIGPPFLGAVLWNVMLTAELLAKMRADGFSLETTVRALQAVGVIFLFAYLVAGLPSIGYMLVMERFFARGLNPTSWRMVWLSTLLGSFCGAVIALATNKDLPVAWLLFIGTGMSVGFGLGLVIKTLSARKPPSETECR
jgi:hypothetical protein